MTNIKKLFVGLCVFFIGTNAFADDVISLFPLTNYDQTITHWIKSDSPDYDKLLLSPDIQKKRCEILYDHYFGAISPWNSNYVTEILQQTGTDNLKTTEQALIEFFSNKGKPDTQIGFGENFHPYSQIWIDKIAENINLTQFDVLSYDANKRAIAIDNLHARVLPTDDVHFYNYKLAGQGYPFDNLQMSAVWAGTPLYVIGYTVDHAWALVITPDFISWVKSKGIAFTNNAFITTWSKAAKTQLAAVTTSAASFFDDKKQFLFSGFIGSIFPLEDGKLMLPVSDADHNAVIKYANTSPENITVMPLSLTPHHFANVIKTMLNRPYGWGSMYFYNDCSAELKSLFTVFGIWLPRHSSEQVKEGKIVDMTAATPDKRLSYLIANGKNFVTIIYIGGHVLLYMGNYPNPFKDHEIMAMTYQNLWGLSPNPPIRRAVIGQSVFFPMLLQYPEDTSLVSLAAKKSFVVANFDQMPKGALQKINLKALMQPEYLYNSE